MYENTPVCVFLLFSAYFLPLKKNTVVKMPLFMLYISEKQGYIVPKSQYIFNRPTPLDGFEIEQVQ